MRWRTLLLSSLTLLTACSNNTPDDTTAPTTTPATTTPAPATTTTTTVVDEEAAVITAYLAYWDTFLVVTNPGQPNSPLIDQVATGDARDRLAQIANDRVLANEATQLPESTVRRHDVTVISVEGVEAVVRDCNVDDSYRMDLETGQQTNADVETNLWSAWLLRGPDGQWRVAESTVLNQWPGAQTCDQ